MNARTERLFQEWLKKSKEGEHVSSTVVESMRRAFAAGVNAVRSKVK